MPEQKLVRTLSKKDLETMIVNIEALKGFDVVPGTFKWVHGWRPVSIPGQGTHNTNEFGGVSYEVRLKVSPYTIV